VQYDGKNIRNSIQYFLHLVLFSFCAFLGAVFVLRILCMCCTLCVFFVLGVFVVLFVYLLYSYVYLLYFMCICCTRRICCTLMCIFCILCVFFVLLMCICCTLCVFVVLCVYCCFLDAGLLARSQYPEGPATGQLDTDFSWFPCVYKRMLRWFPSFQVATSFLSCSPPDLNFLVTSFFPSHICVHVI